ncbi:hypothetical protein ASE01_23720 [Nocardioides sp. Root190]|uniref:hypothetical protein n=1 Tax=Nocardioides sp. Root190 TaxID=1736488 RepID=UPI0006F531F1|nr:hypothetical protein [Nocardioides sp. Root190]KRB78849.1 hypothetical protein ASE01_23720 [Nocardioides sp. Root190]
MAQAPSESGEIVVGTIYEDCAYHPVLCTAVHDDGSVSGISLIDASEPRNCAPDGCGAVPLAVDDIVLALRNFEAYVARRTEELRAEAE